MTKPSTISALRENLKRYHPSEAVAKTRKEMGGCFSSTSEASLPRGHTQAYDTKHRNTSNTLSTGAQKSNDEMTMLNLYAKTEGKNFVRMQDIAKEPLQQTTNLTMWYVFVPVT